MLEKKTLLNFWLKFFFHKIKKFLKMVDLFAKMCRINFQEIFIIIDGVPDLSKKVIWIIPHFSIQRQNFTTVFQYQVPQASLPPKKSSETHLKTVTWQFTSTNWNHSRIWPLARKPRESSTLQMLEAAVWNLRFCLLKCWRSSLAPSC